jgi:DNA-binding transcriptional MocR family regulator
MHQLLQRWGWSGFEAFVTRLQQKYAHQAQIAVAAAAEHLAGLAEWQPVQAGMFMWCKLTGEGRPLEVLHPLGS